MKKIILFLLIIAFGKIYPQEASILKNLNRYDAVLYSNRDSALNYVERASQESIKTKNWFQYSRCLYKLGYLNFMNGEFVIAKKNVSKSINYCRSVKNYKTLSACYNLLGKIEIEKGNYKMSLKNYLFSLKIAEQNNLPQNICVSLNDLAILYDIQKDTVKALEYYVKTKQVALEHDMKGSLLDSYNNIAYLQRKSNVNEAVINYNKALVLAKEVNNKQSEFYIYINLSDLFNKLTPNKSFDYLQQAKQIALELNDSNKLFYVYFNLGGYNATMKNYSKALENYKEALELSNDVDEEQKSNLLEAISDCYLQKGDYKNAYSFQKMYFLKQNELFAVDKAKDFNEIQTKYEVEKKNLKINILTQQKELEQKRKETILLAAVGIIVLLFFALWTYKNRVKTQKKILEKEHLLHEQEKIALQKDSELKQIKSEIEGQDKERNRIAKEIHDGIGGKLAFIKHHLTDINEEIKREDLGKNIHQMGSLFKELRAISHNLSTNYLKNRKFEDLLAELQNDYETNYSLSIELVVYPQTLFDAMDFETRHHFYRIIQELLANIVKHAKATEVSINFTKSESNLTLIVEDNGVGFSDKNTHGIGLKNIKERVTLLNGTLEIESVNGHGSAVVVLTPNLPKKRDKQSPKERGAEQQSNKL